MLPRRRTRSSRPTGDSAQVSPGVPGNPPPVAVSSPPVPVPSPPASPPSLGSDSLGPFRARIRAWYRANPSYPRPAPSVAVVSSAQSAPVAPPSKSLPYVQRRTRASSRSTAPDTKIPPAPQPSSHVPNSGPATFISPFARDLWGSVSQRGIKGELYLDRSRFEYANVLDCLTRLHLLGTVEARPRYSRSLLFEFLANLPQNIEVADPPAQFQTYIRGASIEFSPSSINAFLGHRPTGDVAARPSLDDIVADLTGGSLTSWPARSRGSRLSISKITEFYKVLFKIAHHNWFPTTHISSIGREQAEQLYCIAHGFYIDIGRIIFASAIRHSAMTSQVLLVGFPYTLSAYILSCADVGRDDDELGPPQRPIRVDSRIAPPQAVPPPQHMLQDLLGHRDMLAQLLASTELLIAAQQTTPAPAPPSSSAAPTSAGTVSVSPSATDDSADETSSGSAEF